MGSERVRRAGAPGWGLALVCTILASGPPMVALAAQSPHLTVDRVGALPNLAGTVPTGLRWSADNRGLAFLWNDQGYPFLDVWIVAAGESVPTRVTDMARDAPDLEAQALSSDDRLAARAAARARRGVGEVIWTPDASALIFSYRDELFRINPDGSGLRTLTRAPGAKHGQAFSPDGKRLSFVQDGDLRFMNPVTAEAVPVTHIGELAGGLVPGGLFNQLDVAVSSYSWSPDGRFIALLIEDRTHVRKVLIPNYLGPETRTVPVRRDNPGDNDHERYLSILTLSDGQLRRVPLSDPFDRRFSGYEWSPDGRRLLVDQNSENAVHRWLYLVDPRDNAIHQLWHDERDSRTTQHWASTWRSDGKAILFVSDVDDRHHLYSQPIDGGPAKRLTRGDWSVVGESNPSPIFVAAPSRTLFFVSNQKGPEERQLYRMPDEGGSIVQVSMLAGTHLPIVSPDGRFVATVRSDDVTPPELYIGDASGGTERRITKSPPEEFSKYTWVRPRYVSFKSRTDGSQLYGRILEPPNLDRSKKYAAILGPVYPNSVRNRWGDREEWRGLYSTFQQFLVTEGQYIVVQVDVRGSVGHGRAFRDGILRDYGGIDTEDLHSGADYLKTLPYVDPERLGIWGSSYGGLMTVMSLFRKPGVYRAGVAGAPATNVWHATTGEVHVARRPDTDPEVYQKSSAVSYGENLQDHLMIVHAMLDDIVLFKDSVTLAEKLMLLGKKFDFVVAPNSVHPWTTYDYVAVYLLNKVVDHFDKYLGRGPRTTAASR